MCETALGALLGREAAGLASPTLDRAPAPDGRASELAEWLWEAGADREDVHSLRRDAQPLRDVDRDDELGPVVDPHASTIAQQLF